ncbi:hypothetical protein L2E82_39748 [Cichorium intybus]|uniref:Uncharacterized protein n=1 Tax=Cichorium intybus TaxID=13427 RepID=A0ACB9AJE2_CICIN|nr:hypothetical protein L2E82_39748 [Cichorium intybus]
MDGPPDWLKLPNELMANILQRLNYIDILNSAWKVCLTWQKICKDPAMWKVIDIPSPVYRHDYDIDMLIRQAVDLSRGELIEFSIAGFEIIDLLDFVVRRSSKLKRLCMKNCHEISDRGFGWEIKRLPELEKLHLANTYLTAKDIEEIGQNCPKLKSFTMNHAYDGPHNDDNALAIANNMPELRHLQVIGDNMTRIGLEGILNGCPHLESLDVRRCFYLRLGGKFGKLCMERIKDLKRPHYSMENSGFHIEYDESDIYDHMYDPVYSDADDSSEDDFYENNEFSGGKKTSKEEEYEYDYDYEYYY